MKRIMILLLSSLFILSACAEPASIQQVENTSAAPQDVAEPAPSTPTYSLGDTIQYDALKITLDAVRTSTEGELSNPDNDHYVILQLTIENTGSEPANVSTLLQMELYDAEGFKQEIAIFADTKGSLDGEIGVGRKSRGEVAFDAETSEFYEFAFKDPFKSGQAIWEFEVE